jgi:hypothetical protein
LGCQNRERERERELGREIEREDIPVVEGEQWLAVSVREREWRRSERVMKERERLIKKEKKNKESNEIQAFLEGKKNETFDI